MEQPNEIIKTGEPQKVKLELELDTTQKKYEPNKFQTWVDLAVTVDSWRIFPRLFITIYIVLLYKTCVWFMGLDTPSLEQSGFVSIVVGAGAAWFGLYAGTGGASKTKLKQYD
tara:strand:+ start:74 stop:412 length:339 start_codon:yes stop_codon:yes gene_type:complete